jgi:putative IMPACT (imprinted ancient) family translation regulator
LTLYSKEEIRAALKESKELDPKTRHFCSWYFDIPENELQASYFYG